MDNIFKPIPSENTSFTPKKDWHLFEMTITRSDKSDHRLNNKKQMMSKKEPKQ